MKIVYLALGTNLGDRESALRTALEKLHREDLRVNRVSSVYETAPMDVADQPDFLNIVVEAETTLMPMRLLSRVMGIEREMGRKRLAPKGPRNIDIDILLHGPSVVDTPQLQIPHPRMLDRRFVLEPLAELAPELRHPVTRRTIREQLLAVRTQRVLRTGLRLDAPTGSH